MTPDGVEGAEAAWLRWRAAAVRVLDGGEWGDVDPVGELEARDAAVRRAFAKEMKNELLSLAITAECGYISPTGVCDVAIERLDALAARGAGRAG